MILKQHLILRTIISRFYLLLLLLLSTCCKPEPTTTAEIEVITMPADITVSNKTTGQYARYSTERKKTDSVDGEIVTTIIENQVDTLLFNNNDILQIKYTPIHAYEDKITSVNFKFFDIDSTMKSEPYVIEYQINPDIPTGSYDIECKAFVIPNFSEVISNIYCFYQSCVIGVK